MKKILLFTLLLWIQVLQMSLGQEVVTIPYDDQGAAKTFEAVLTLPKADRNGKAVVILHHSGGWGVGTTRQYAEFLSANGFTTLEPRMFNVRTDRFAPFLPQMFAALGYLGAMDGVDKNQISVMGLSFGGMMAVFAASQVVNTDFNKSGLQFAKYAPFYPSCWLHAAIMNRTLPRLLAYGLKFDPAILDKFNGRPLKVFAGGADDYDDKDPEVCHFMVASMKDEEQKAKTEVVVYPTATHGWDQAPENFYEPLIGCKGKGCRITIRPNADVTQQAKNDLLDFLRR